MSCPANSSSFTLYGVRQEKTACKCDTGFSGENCDVSDALCGPYGNYISKWSPSGPDTGCVCDSHHWGPRCTGVFGRELHCEGCGPDEGLYLDLGLPCSTVVGYDTHNNKLRCV